MAQSRRGFTNDDGVRCCFYCHLPLPTLETGVAGKEVRVMTNERIINAVEEFMTDIKQQVLFELKQDPEWMETTLQAENVKEWANNLIQTEVTGIVENTDRIAALESQIEEMNQEDDIRQVDDRVDEVESRLEKIEARIDSVTREEVAEMMRQAFQGAIDTHWHILNDSH